MSIKKKIGGAIMATALGAALVAGGSYALFTDTAENAGNTFTTGGVTIEDVNTTFESKLYIDNLAPGDSETWSVTIKNNDNLDAWVKVSGYETEGYLFNGGDYPLTIDDNNQVMKIPAGQSKDFTFTYRFPTQAGNEYQKKSGELTINFQAVQVRNNDAGNGPISWD